MKFKQVAILFLVFRVSLQFNVAADNGKCYSCVHNGNGFCLIDNRCYTLSSDCATPSSWTKILRDCLTIPSHEDTTCTDYNA